MYPTIPPPPQRLLVFARVPELGAVKSRLAADLGEDRALAAYRAMLRDTLQSVGASDASTEVEVLWAPTPAADGEVLRDAFGDRVLAVQTGTTLGDRLAMAFSERFFFHRTQKIVAIGVDDPQLSRELIDHAFALLDACDFVVGPAHDGGYYLIGCRAAPFSIELFLDVPLETENLFRRTLAKIRETQRTVAVLPMRDDIDDVAGLRRYAADAYEGELAAVLREWGWT